MVEFSFKLRARDSLHVALSVGPSVWPSARLIFFNFGSFLERRRKEGGKEGVREEGRE